MRRRHGRSALAATVLVVAALALSACDGTSTAQSAKQSLYSGIAAQRAGQYGIATKDYEAVLKVAPKDVYALYDLGDVEQFRHQDAPAKAYYEKVLALSPKFENALYNLAILDTRSAPGQAKALYQEVVALAPKDAVAHLNLGKVLLQLGEKGAGDAQVNLAVKLEPSLKSIARSTS